VERKEIFRTLKFLDCNHLRLIETESFFRLTCAFLEWIYHLDGEELNFQLSHSTIVIINNMVVYAHTEKSPHVQ
jgi:hypothetical protein